MERLGCAAPGVRPRAALVLLAWCWSAAAQQVPAALPAGDADEESPSSDWRSKDWQTSDWATAEGANWGYTCSVAVDVDEMKLMFMDGPIDSYEERLQRAKRFAVDFNLQFGGGCADADCAAALIVAAVDATACAKLLRAGVVFIPVGLSCAAAYALRDSDARGAAFPFDWNISPLDAVNDAISCALRNGTCAADWFSHLRFDSASIGGDSFTLSSGLGIVESDTDFFQTNVVPALADVSGHFGKARVLFPHDFLEAHFVHGGYDFEELERVVSKYDRRFRRLARLLRRGGGPAVYFVVQQKVSMDAVGDRGFNEWQRTVLDNFGVDKEAFTGAATFARDVDTLKSIVSDLPHVRVVDVAGAYEIIDRVISGQSLRSAT
ncbi:hypothetical protein M885DRAFT_527317 [Pelagophyceae sp. CCMP2097]|nr:hypothetical protein M885DRAFT_527317 [Pelagophyceae sp. CCMP2097]